MGKKYLSENSGDTNISKPEELRSYADESNMELEVRITDKIKEKVSVIRFRRFAKKHRRSNDLPSLIKNAILSLIKFIGFKNSL